jgi:membrane-bound lytic murein transglycosylase D
MKPRIPFILLLLPAAAVLLSDCGTARFLSRINLTADIVRIQTEVSAERARKGLLAVDFNSRTWFFLRQYLGGARGQLRQILERSYYFVPMMKQVFKEEGLPEDLVYLPVIESGYLTSATSSKHASGPWQFMAGTGRLYGLADNWWIDERRDPEKSTRAAARHLKILYSLFGDWNLALAAYNAGDGSVRNAIRKTGVRDFWQISEWTDKKDRKKKAFPRETLYYVPKFLAAVATITHLRELGLDRDFNYGEALRYDKASIPDSTDLEVIARCCGTDYGTIKACNPELKQWATPPEMTNYQVKIPPGTAELFRRNFDSIPASNRITYRRYQVGAGDTISGIARKYSVPQSEIISFNRITDPALIRASDYIIVPIRGERGASNAAPTSFLPGSPEIASPR